MKTILGCAAAAGLLTACLAGVKGDRGANDCQVDADCGGGVLGQRCSRGECVNAPCDDDTDCTAIRFDLICDRGVECRRQCVAAYYDSCPFGTVCVDGFCELEESGTLSAGVPLPLGPGAAGGGGAPPPFPIPDDGYPYDEGN